MGEGWVVRALGDETPIRCGNWLMNAAGSRVRIALTPLAIPPFSISTSDEETSADDSGSRLLTLLLLSLGAGW